MPDEHRAPPSLLTTAYWPPIHWFHLACRTPLVFMEACEHYQKGSIRNRCFVAGPNGLQRLSIPLLKGKHQQTPIRDVRISYSDAWQRLHWRSLTTAYGNAPFFEHYVDELAPFYHQKHHFLYDYNLECLHWLLRKLAIDLSVQETSAYAETAPGTVLDARPAAYPENLTVKTPRYGQVFEERHGFLPNLSVLDLLFCTGRQAGEIIANTQVAP